MYDIFLLRSESYFSRIAVCRSRGFKILKPSLTSTSGAGQSVASGRAFRTASDRGFRPASDRGFEAASDSGFEAASEAAKVSQLAMDLERDAKRG